MQAQEGPQRIFCDLPPEIPLVFYGGAAGGGKSWSLLYYLFQFVDDPEFHAVCFRKSLGQLERALFKEAKAMYRPLITDKNGKFIGKAKINDSKGNYKVVFPSGALIEFAYLTCEKDAIDNFQGAELTAACFDEFTHFDEASFNYIRTRMRSKSKYPSFIRCSMNPHPNHFVRDKYLDAFIVSDENSPRYGVIDKHLNGKIRYFLFNGGEIKTSWDQAQLTKENNPKYAVSGDTKDIKFPARPYTVVGSSLADNPAMLAHNEHYEADLQANSAANAAMLLDGNWHYTPPSNGFFDRGSIQEVMAHDVPYTVTVGRGWDKASTEPNPAQSGYNPDYTTSIKMSKDAKGNIYVQGDYCYDKEGQELARFRKKAGMRDEMILDQCKADGEEVYVVLPKDPAQAGEVEYLAASKALQEEGFLVVKDPMPSNKSKYKRFEPFCTASHNGYVFFVRDSFNKKTLDYLYLELENFDNDTNNGYKDDMVDATGSVFNWLATKRVFKPCVLPKATQTTSLTKHRRSMR